MLSVIIATQNRDEQLYNTLQAWRHQSVYDDVELVVVNDGGSMDVQEYCRPFEVTLIHLPHTPGRGNPSIAWTEGIVRSHGDVVACTHAEIIPDVDVARFLYGACIGNAVLTEGLGVWYSPQHQAVDVAQCGDRVLRANVPALRINRDWALPREWSTKPVKIQDTPGFWDKKTEFGGHTNDEIRGFVGFFWNNLFAMRREVWDWIHYFRPLESWGVDDSDFQRRNVQLKMPYVFPADLYGYHQWHARVFGEGGEDPAELMEYATIDEARLCDLYGGHGEPSPLILSDTLPVLE